MSFPALVLRIALCLALVLNGSGYAFAATAMQLEHAAHNETTVSAPAAEMAPCHDAVDASASVGHSMDPVPAAHHATAVDSPDCCDGPHCQSGCAQSLIATLSENPRRGVPVAHAVEVRAMQTRHAAPPLPNPIRPPIG